MGSRSKLHKKVIKIISCVRFGHSEYALTPALIFGDFQGHLILRFPLPLHSLKVDMFFYAISLYINIYELGLTFAVPIEPQNAPFCTQFSRTPGPPVGRILAYHNIVHYTIPNLGPGQRFSPKWRYIWRPQKCFVPSISETFRRPCEQMRNYRYLPRLIIPYFIHMLHFQYMWQLKYQALMIKK